MAVRETQSRKRHDEIYDEYLRLLGEFKAKYKEDACSMSKKWIYTQVAENLGWSKDHVYHVVSKMVKCRKT